MRKRAKMRLAVLGGMIAGAMVGCWLLDVLEAAANWMLVHWMGLDIGKAAARAPAMSGLMLCGLFGVGLYLYCRLTRCRAQLLGLVGEEERYRNDV